MKWTRITIKTLAEAEEIIISTMYDIGLEGAQIEDNVPLTEWEKEQMFVDILPDAPDNDNVAYLHFFVEEPQETEDGGQESTAGLSDDADNSYFAVGGKAALDVDALVEQIKDELEQLRMFMDIGEGTVTVSETQDADWVNNWKDFFHQFYIDDLLVTPSWETVKPQDRDKKILNIDPGTAFGTGMHETTQLCIRALKKYVAPGAELLDVGTGSGILGIVALMHGAGSVVGTDLDPCVEAAVRENLEANAIPREQFEVMIGNIISDREIQDRIGYEKYDIVTANILAQVLVALTPFIVRCMKPGGVYITSGIICGKEDLVINACREAGMEVLAVARQGEWMSVTAQKVL